jgi:hypothetical protein
MRKHWSKLGFTFLSAYILLTAYSVIYALTCSGFLCGFSLFIPIMPLAFVSEMLGMGVGFHWLGVSDGHSWMNIGIYISLILLHGFLLYMLGYVLERIYQKLIRKAGVRKETLDIWKSRVLAGIFFLFFLWLLPQKTLSVENMFNFFVSSLLIRPIPPHFDYYSLVSTLGFVLSLVLNFLMLIAAVGLFKKRRWAYRLGFMLSILLVISVNWASNFRNILLAVFGFLVVVLLYTNRALYH